MADYFTRVPGPLEVMRRLGLNVPSRKQVGKLFTAAPEFVGPQADVAGMVRDAGQVMPNIQSGDYGQALANLGMAAAAIPFMAIPGTVSQVKKLFPGPKMTRQEFKDVFLSRSKDRQKWGAERKERINDLRDQVKEVQKYRGHSLSWQGPPKRTWEPSRKVELEDVLVTRSRNRPYEADKLRSARPYLALDKGNFWGKRFRKEVSDKAGNIDIYGRQGVAEAINRANMEAVPRILKKEGWTLRHGSKGRSGRKSSRYLVSPDKDYELRLSDHYLPDTMERAHSRSQYGTRWDDEIVLGGTESPDHIIDNIKKLYLETK